MSPIKLVAKKGSTFHDFPYSSPKRKCFHCWIINVTPPGPSHCLHHCIYCYAREAIYSNFSEDTLVYSNLPELVEKDLKKLKLCPPISLSNISDPCQDIPELKKEVKRLIRLLMDYGIAFAITTKGDPSFLLEIPDFVHYEPKFIAVTIEGTPEILQLLSPKAPPFAARLRAVRQLSSLGISTVIRLDPVFIHLFQAVYGDTWFDRIARLIDTFSTTGAKHLIAGTGRLSKRIPQLVGCRGESMWQRISQVIVSQSSLVARKFETEYVYELGWAGRGYLLRKEIRLNFHRQLREVVEARGMTYATCQELSAEESDSSGLPSCEGILLPFTRKGADGKFHPIPDCTANCHISCLGLTNPPCGQPKLIACKPLKFSHLCLDARSLPLM